MTDTQSPQITRDLYLEDVTVGDRFVSGEHALDAEQIKTFAAQYDPQPFHLDEAAGAQSLFGGLAASGWHTAAITMKLFVASMPFAEGLIGAGVEVTWPKPTRADDVLHVESTVQEIKHSRSRPGRGIVTVETLTLNQDGEIRQRLVSRMVMFSRPEG
ncbi:MaoC family dehydratase [Alloyangia pacifica]|uniref:Acyl dehydratase n=1 Tax=Alloyangia pacifica TaxID=311180 RepID=A0A1I6UN27_9RHOB|nr:MaoC family dehydratase [Alloyangia pacifica]SDH75971.1 Acyl dehydratase [Alloyangia pacifica]SFT02798.1 Acyl dehydratase [Alloyangia pacifica]